MATINVDPEGLRKAGETLNQARETLVDGSNAHLLHGVGKDQHISTAGFWPGVWAQRELTERYNEAQQAFMEINNNIIALSSALHIVADVFDSAEQANALEFAFMNPDAEVPAGLPGYVDPKVNSVKLREQAEAAAERAALANGKLPDGHTRRETVTSPYTRTIEILDENGKVVSTIYVSSFGGRTTTTTYDGKRQLINSQVEERIGGRTVLTTYDRNDRVVSTRVAEAAPRGGMVVRTYTGAEKPANLAREEYRLTASDGTTNYHTNVHRNGHTQTVDRFSVAPEPTGARSGDDLIRQIEEQEHQSAIQARRAKLHAGNAFEGPHNRVVSYRR